MALYDPDFQESAEIEVQVDPAKIRLEKLGRHMAKLALRQADGPRLDMTYYFAIDGNSLDMGPNDVTDLHYCGTSACVAGHAALIMPELRRGSWLDVISQLTPAEFVIPSGRDLNHAIFDSLFSSSLYSNFLDAADRIAYVLETGEVRSQGEFTFDWQERCVGAAQRAGWLA